MKTRKLFLCILLMAILSSCTDDSKVESFDSQSEIFNNYTYIDDESIDVPASGDSFNEIIENPFVDVEEEAVSTFSIDADGASYSYMRRIIQQHGQLPDVNSVIPNRF